MLNFLYCFDKNYNIQAAVSIYSLLENLDEQILFKLTSRDEIF